MYSTHLVVPRKSERERAEEELPTNRRQKKFQIQLNFQWQTKKPYHVHVHRVLDPFEGKVWHRRLCSRVFVRWDGGVAKKSMKRKKKMG